MKKNCSIIFAFLFYLNCCLALCPTEKGCYLAHVDKALDVGRFDERFDPSLYPNLRGEVKELFLRIYEKEKAHPDFIQCVTAQDSRFYAYQVIAKELYRKLYGQPREEFEFLRFPTQNLLKTKEEFFSRYPSLIYPSKEELAKHLKTTPDQLKEALKAYEIKEEENFLRELRGEEKVEDDSSDEDDEDEDDEDEVPAHLQLNDTVPEISKELLSVNFTMETYRPLDSTLFVFLEGKSVSLFSLSQNEAILLQQMGKALDELDERIYHEKLNKIFYELFDACTLPQEKLAVFIEKLVKNSPHMPLGIINQILIPKESIQNCLYMSFPGGFMNQVYDADFEEIHQEFQNNRQEEFFRTFRNFQARVIAGSLFEDPRIKIVRYTLIPEDTQRQYEALVREAIEDLLAGEEIALNNK
jgi:hypothetical protein